MNQRRRKHSYDYLFLSLILILYGVNLYRLAALDREPPMWDEAVHLKDSLVYYSVLTDPFQLTPAIITKIVAISDDYPLLRPSGYYPPLVAMSTAPAYLVLGRSAQAAVMSNLFFVSILVVSLYSLCTCLLDRKAGLAAAVLVVLLPVVLQNSLTYMLDLPLMAMLALSFLALVKTDDFRDRKWSIALGIALGLGMLTKWTFLFFVVGPLLYLVMQALRRETRPFVNAFLSAAFALGTFGPYYLPILPRLISETVSFSRGPLAGGPDALISLDSLAFYPVSLWVSLITPAGVILLGVGFVTLVASRNRYKVLLLVAALVPYCVFTFAIATKQPRFMLPWLVYLIVLMVYPLSGCDGSQMKLRRILKPVFFLCLLSIGVSFVQTNLQVKESLAEAGTRDWRIESIIAALKQDRIEKEKNGAAQVAPVYVGVIPDHHFVNGQTLRYFAALQKLPMTFIKLQNYKGTALEEFRENFSRYEYIVTKDLHSIDRTEFKESIDRMLIYFQSQHVHFTRLASFEMPDSSVVEVYARGS